MSDNNFDSNTEDKISQAYENLQRDSEKVNTMEALRKVTDKKVNSKNLIPALIFCSVLAILALGGLAFILNSGANDSSESNIATDDMDKVNNDLLVDGDSMDDDLSDNGTAMDDEKADTSDRLDGEGNAMDDPDEGNSMDDPALQELTCSAVGMTNQSAASGSSVVDAKLSAVVDAAIACDWDGLESLMDNDFTASFGGDDAIKLWKENEANGGQILRELVLVASIKSSISDNYGYIWPWFFNSWECGDALDSGPTSANQFVNDMAKLGIDPISDCKGIDSDIYQGYLGYRIGITDAGEWTFFVAGD